MQNRIQDILLVCSTYDKFMLDEDGRVDEQLFQEYVSLNLHYPPKFTHVSTADDAFRELDAKYYDLVITMLNIGKYDAIELAKQIRASYSSKPVIVLTPFSRELSLLMQKENLNSINYIFSWLGESNILLAIVKLLEDKMNIEADVKEVGVQAILLVEDSVRYYSSYLPVIYRILFQHASRLMEDGLNEWEQTMRMRGRPKILLARDYEEAKGLYDRYKGNLLGVISDISYKREGARDVRAGFRFSEYIRSDNLNIPILLQSSEKNHDREAVKYNAGFLHKESSTLLSRLRKYLEENYGFGDFAFRTEDSPEILARASDLRELQYKIKEIPEKSFIYHLVRDDFSRWLKARAYFTLADIFIDKKYSDFPSVDAGKEYLFDTILNFRISTGRGVIAEFQKQRFDENSTFTRVGNGSLGGKGRGLAFIDHVLKQERLRYKYDGIVITIPVTVVLTTDVFEEFMDLNNLFESAVSDIDDQELLNLFLKADLPESLVEVLHSVVSIITKPIAVRSSSLLEDSLHQPFAGVYATYMLPNNNDSLNKRFEDLKNAVKCVYASTYYKSSKEYMRITRNVIDEEKMAVIIQEITGTIYPDKCYPTFSGVARSINFYPVGKEKSEDGIVNLAFGLGKTVVDGGVSLRFSPGKPKKIIQLSDPDIALKSTQNHFYALNMDPESFKPVIADNNSLHFLNIDEGNNDPNFKLSASTYDFADNRIRDGIAHSGRRVITFSGILKYKMFPLVSILKTLLKSSQENMNVPVEIEFAADLNPRDDSPIIFSFLQIRPIVSGFEKEDIEIDGISEDDIIVSSNNALGHGLFDDIRDIIYIKPEVFNPADTEAIAEVLEELNTAMTKKDRFYILIVPGRLGSSDPWLGIPVKWTQITNTRVIIESGLENFRIDPSQGSHFFQNITSLQIPYLTINPFTGDGFLDIDYLNKQESEYEDKYLRHIRFKFPLEIRVDGRHRKAVIIKGENI